MISPILLYGHAYCGMVRPVRQLLNGAGADYTYIDILNNEDGRERVRKINSGNESVPTLVFPDGSTLTEPSYLTLTRKLGEMGYAIPTGVRLQTAVLMYSFSLVQLLAVIIFLYGLLSLLGVI